MSQQKKPTNAERRRIAREKIAAQRAAEARRQRNMRIAAIAGGAVLTAGVIWGGIAIANSNSGSSSGTVAGAVLADNSKDATGQTVNGKVGVNTMEQTAYHIHAHLTIYVNGVQKAIPYGIGIVPPWQTNGSGTSTFVTGGSKFYYLHTHDETGVIHIESPNQVTYSLGDFFAVWGQPLSTSQVGPAKGTVYTYVNGKKYSGNPADITLTAHENIQLNVGKDMPFKNFDWTNTGE
jgi:hypothetical protein